MTDLQSLIDTTPDGGTLTLEPGRYDNSETVWIRDRHGLTIDGTGAVLCRKNAAEGLNRQLQIFGSSDITIRYLTVNGPKPDDVGYQVAYESQHAFSIDSSSTVLIEQCVATRSWGDHFYVSGGCRDVTVKLCHGWQCGRHGISVTSVSGLLFAGNQFDLSHRWSVDLEPGTSVDRIDHCTVAYNGFYRPTIGFVSGADNPDPASLVIGGNVESWDPPPTVEATA